MKKAATTDQTIFSIYAEDKKGLLGQVLVYFNRKNYNVISLNVSRTDLNDIVLVTIEAILPANELQPFTERLKKIIEVYTITTYAGNLKKTGFYRMARASLNNELWLLMTTYGASLSTINESTFVINKTGTDKDLSELYAKLDGPHLLGFCKSGLIVEDCLNHPELI